MVFAPNWFCWKENRLKKKQLKRKQEKVPNSLENPEPDKIPVTSIWLNTFIL